MQITALHWLLPEQEPISMAYSSGRAGLVGSGFCKREGFDALQSHIPDWADSQGIPAVPSTHRCPGSPLS